MLIMRTISESTNYWIKGVLIVRVCLCGLIYHIPSGAMYHTKLNIISWGKKVHLVKGSMKKMQGITLKKFIW